MKGVGRLYIFLKEWLGRDGVMRMVSFDERGGVGVYFFAIGGIGFRLIGIKIFDEISIARG